MRPTVTSASASASASAPASASASASNTLLLGAAFAYLAFVIYGSLVPWNFQPYPLDQAWLDFSTLPYLKLGIGSRADWVANILLFIPLAFLWLGVFWPRRGLISRVSASLLVFALCLALSLGIEFTQLFFPPRTVSQNDILAEGIGAVLGIFAWWWKGPALRAWVAGWRSARGSTSIAERLLWLYLAFFFGYNLLPLDLTISPVEIYHKWQEGKLALIPFTHFPGDVAQWIYNLVTDVVLWIPVSLLWILSGKKRGMAAWAWTVLAAIVLEGLQLLVYSRVTDVTDILMAMVGGALGAWLGKRWQSPEPYPLAQLATRQIRLWLFGSAGFLLWTLVLMMIFWYPFDFVLERDFLHQRLQLFNHIPFRKYYYGTEFRAVTEVLHKVLFFAPLGVALALPRLSLPGALARRLFDIMALLVMATVALGIELGQVALPAKYPDTTDWLLATLGGVLGYGFLLFCYPRLFRHHADYRRPVPTSPAKSSTAPFPNRRAGGQYPPTLR